MKKKRSAENNMATERSLYRTICSIHNKYYYNNTEITALNFSVSALICIF